MRILVFLNDFFIYFVIDSRIISGISGEYAWYILHTNVTIFVKKTLTFFRPNFRILFFVTPLKFYFFFDINITLIICTSSESS